METEGGSQLFDSEKGGRGGSFRGLPTEEKGSSLFGKKKKKIRTTDHYGYKL